MVDQNVRPLHADHSAYDWSELDPSSIMVYASNPDFLKKQKKSRCYFHENNKLSLLTERAPRKRIRRKMWN